MRSILSNLLTLMIVGLCILAGAVFWGQREFTQPGPLTQATVITVERGATLNGVARVLEDAGAISNTDVFRLGARYTETDRGLRFGEYEIPAGASMEEILELLNSGRSILYQVTIPEGWTSWQAVQRINENELLVGEITEMPPEGSLAPNTYSIERGMERQALVDLMMEAQAEIVAEAWENRAEGLPLESPEELLILASIVEKETGVSAEREQVASVFVNRINRGMRLQTDPTVIYGITLGEGTLGRGLRRSELDAETPYNTYVIPGLPPTPIANPGRASIEATANPAETDYFFFVADGTGGHAFSVTYEEHNRNVARWRAIERQRSESQ
ncbi:endolytic transglycosylase MltG [Pontivivens ytuae]|uniref:Endolytic murein transglycosylase n=1 Tax=Pontivivens ytuae TaxID=2789856 RepID=A0A7S9LR83_9RHOB|nr:endolytic transglycosylase MltG [Pontivivens ytuae]QPH53773.1 endolytic transglycosylase MltG [Pontivivens ytuae]